MDCSCRGKKERRDEPLDYCSADPSFFSSCLCWLDFLTWPVALTNLDAGSDPRQTFEVTDIEPTIVLCHHSLSLAQPNYWIHIHGEKTYLGAMLLTHIPITPHTPHTHTPILLPFSSLLLVQHHVGCVVEPSCMSNRTLHGHPPAWKTKIEESRAGMVSCPRRGAERVFQPCLN
jgi:hypothetical protein